MRFQHRVIHIVLYLLKVVVEKLHDHFGGNSRRYCRVNTEEDRRSQKSVRFST